MEQQLGILKDMIDPSMTPSTGQIIYIIDSDPEEVARRYHDIPLMKNIIAGYAINSRHCLVVYVSGIVRRNKKKINKE